MSALNPQDLPGRKCQCAGNCSSSNTSFSRREFLGVLGVSGAAALLPLPALADFELPADQLEQWKRSLRAPAAPRRYSSETHKDARLHLGGIGTGNFEIGADGQFTTWQLFNTLRDGEVPFHFLLKTGSCTRLLQTTGGPDWPRVQRIEMTGEYPIAELQFHDPDLPVNLVLTAFSPFSPLDAEVSAIPLAMLIFKVRNGSPQPQTVSLAALIQNPIGYEAGGQNNTLHLACFGGNVNEPLREGQAGGLLMRATAEEGQALEKPLQVFTLANLRGLSGPPADRPRGFDLQILGDLPALPDNLTASTSMVIWLEAAPATIPASFLGGVKEAVKRGAVLLFSGSSMPLLEAYGSWTGGKPIGDVAARPDILFEDFEHGYDKWKVEGEAFGSEPAHGTLPNQQRVSGFVGQGLVNTYLNGDDTTGRLISKPFAIERRFIRFLVGGGRHAQTQIRLVIEGKTVRATSGKDNEHLEPAIWDVGQWQGQTAHIEIIDEQKGPWGHINVDQIEFSDLPGERALMLALEELLPARLSGVSASPDPTGERKLVRLENLMLQAGAVESRNRTGLLVITRALGKGKVVIAAGPVLEPSKASISNCRRQAYESICELAGINYSVPPGPHPKAPGFGTVALATLAQNPTVQPAFEDLREAYETFAAKGAFTPIKNAHASSPTVQGSTTYGAVAATVSVPPGKTVEVPFLLAWHYPNKYSQGSRAVWMGCHYATRWPDARAVIRETARNYLSLRERTERFRKVFYDSTLPYWLLDCLTANAAILRHIGVVFRIANGDVYGWEGSNGCCNPTCTHVWGYEQTLSRLFPALEREMRRIDFKHQQRADGGVNNRTDVPSPPRPTGEQPFADGHASCILKAYREALNSPNDAFLKDYWPAIKRAVEYLIGRDAKGSNGEPAGILQDDQWNTYDEALHGVTTFISGYYLAALRAGEEWARRIGETATADRLRSVFEKGQKKLIELCWNGEYFQQHLPDYLNRQGEVGPGCMAEQLIGQWWAHQLGLGYLFPKDMVVSALRAVFKYNFKSDLTGWRHAPRAFAGDKDKGLIICTWPKGGRPASVMLYSDEVWTGIEYQVASHMIYEGLIDDGLAIVKAARERYDGVPRAPIQRNPWNEIECGGHYARAMSSWSLLLALSGWEYDGARKSLRFAPRYNPQEFKSFFAGPEGWGSVRQSLQGQRHIDELHVSEGLLEVRELTLAPLVSVVSMEAYLDGRKLTAQFAALSGLIRITFEAAVVVRAGKTLSLEIQP